MMFERRSVAPDAFIPRSVQTWNARQRRQHQYTPSRAALQTCDGRVLRDAFAADIDALADYVAQPNQNVPPYLPASHRRLVWEKRCHHAATSTFTDKISGAPSPAERRALQAVFESGEAAAAGSRMGETSHAALRRKISAHKTPIFGVL